MRTFASLTTEEKSTQNNLQKLRAALLRTSVGLFLAFVVTVHAAAASTIRVPTDQPTIQAAINFAVNGDTVLVASKGKGRRQ